MNKKLFIPAIISGLLLSALSFRQSYKANYADDVINFDVNAIEALSHKDGATINFVNDYIKEYWDNDASDLDKLRTLYEMNEEISSFAENAYDHVYTRDLYANWDDFKPVNNTLNWRSNVKANSFDIVVSLDSELTNVLYEEKGLTDASYTMANPLANAHYYWQVTAHTNNGNVKSSIFDFYSGDYKRTLDIPTVSNTRDVGGFTTEYGTMQQGLIFRSARLDDINSTALDSLAQLDIQTDLDLRNDGEGIKNPANLPNYYLRTMSGYYMNAFNDTNRSNTIEAVRIFANPNNYPIIFHCAVGRDRTGTLALILQALAGASKEYIIHDYYTSMWSVTGAYQKTLSDLNYSILNSTFEALESFGDSINTGVVNFLKQKEDPNTHEMVGLTDEEIQAIRDIWSGKTPVAHGQKTFKAEENYEGKAFVKIKAIVHNDVSMMVTKGTTITAPYQLDNSLTWYSNGKTFNFTNPINEETFIYADYVIQYVIVIHFVGIARGDEIKKLNPGETITISEYMVDGFDMVAISDEGKEMNKFEATRDAYINIIYYQK